MIFAAWILAWSVFGADAIAGVTACTGTLPAAVSTAGNMAAGTAVVALGLRAAGLGVVALAAFLGAALGTAGLATDLVCPGLVVAAGLAAFLVAGLAVAAVVVGLALVLAVSAGAAFFATVFLGAGTGGFTSSGVVIAKTPY